MSSFIIFLLIGFGLAILWDIIKFFDKKVKNYEGQEVINQSKLATPMRRLGGYIFDIAITSSFIALGPEIFVISLGLWIIFWFKSSSPGKFILGMKVYSTRTEKPLGFIGMFARETIGYFISSVLFMVGYLWILIDNKNQGWHDKLVSSVVLDKEMIGKHSEQSIDEQNYNDNKLVSDEQILTSQGNFDVILVDAGVNKIKVIKIVKEINNLGLRESKTFVDNLPKTVKEKVSKEEAELLSSRFEGAGAAVEIRPREDKEED